MRVPCGVQRGSCEGVAPEVNRKKMILLLKCVTANARRQHRCARPGPIPTSATENSSNSAAMRRLRWCLWCLALGAAAKRRKKRSTATDSDVATTVNVGDTGLAVHVSNGPASKTLRAWAAQLGDRGASHGEASMREEEVHTLIAAGDWPEHAWHEYQRLAAGAEPGAEIGTLSSR